MITTSQHIGFLNTPPLWNSSFHDVLQFKLPSVDLAMFESEAIPENIRLGHQVEHIFKQLVQTSKTYDILIYNLPIRRQKTTLGEIDFILRDKIRSKLIHVELTYKFYIIDPDLTPPIHSLIGPNRRDTFFNKIEKIKNIQFPLLHSSEGSLALHCQNIDPSTVEHQCCFKAQLFKPYDISTSAIGPLNSDCIVGNWMRMEDFRSIDFRESQFYLPTKSEWIISPNSKTSWMSYQEALAEIQARLLKENSPLVWIKHLDGSYEKVFVVWW